MTRHFGGVAALFVVASTWPISAQRPSLDIVLDRAATYVANFKRELAGIVAEEEYLQEMTDNGNGMARVSRRTLKSDLLLVRPGAADRYVEFRDVFEVDGKPVRDREERLSNLFVNPQSSTEQLQRIINESARHNLGRGLVQRNINIPTLVLLFLDPAYRSRFRFSRADNDPPALADPPDKSNVSPLFRVSTEMWAIEYRETQRNTIVRTPSGKDIPARGRLWVEPSTGRLLMTELLLGDPGLRTKIDVSYQSEPLRGFLVPAQMREQYLGPKLIITGSATYRNFRQFNVQVDEKAAPIVR